MISSWHAFNVPHLNNATRTITLSLTLPYMYDLFICTHLYLYNVGQALPISTEGKKSVICWQILARFQINLIA